MHGNVYEWCLDDWHDNYEGAPVNGSAWLDNNNDNTSQSKAFAVLRGGSWQSISLYCRSAFRSYDVRSGRGSFGNYVGFRVVCGVGRILQ